MILERGKEKGVEELMEEHLNIVGRCLEELVELVNNYVRKEKKYTESALAIHNQEGKADDLRKEIEAKIHAGAFMPIYRGDYIRIADLVDKIADKAESVGDFLVLVKPTVPAGLNDDLILLTKSTIAPFNHLQETFKFLREDLTKVGEVAKKVDQEEGKVDSLEWDLVKKIYKMGKVELAAKNLLRELINKIADISDWIQDACDAIELTAARRKV